MPSGDVRVRKALSMAINRAEMMDTLALGMGIPGLPSRVNPSSMDIDQEYWQKWGAERYLRYDPAEAKQLLKDAGYADGFTIKMFEVSTTGYNPQLGSVIMAFWKDIGVKTELMLTDETSYRERRSARRGTGAGNDR